VQGPVVEYLWAVEVSVARSSSAGKLHFSERTKRCYRLVFGTDETVEAVGYIGMIAVGMVLGLEVAVAQLAK
jgi:hypothetical protein